MANSVVPFLMFTGQAQAAMNLYVGLFARSSIDRLDLYGPGEPGAAGSVRRADFTVAGQHIMCIDSPVQHAFTFTPSVSLFVECEDEAELDRAVAELSAAGQLLMEPSNYGFSRKFAWLNDRFGVSWQLNWQ